MSDPAGAARDRLLDEHEETLRGVVAAADAVAADWEEMVDGSPATTDRDRVVAPLRAELQHRGIYGDLTDLLTAAVDATPYDLRATPVPGPPYVVVTSTGPILRATLEGGRLVVAIEVFELRRGDPTRYVRIGDEPGEVLSVTLR